MRTKQFAVLHIEKGSGNATRLGSHIERKHQPPNADPEKAHLNQHVITGHDTLNKDIDNRIKEAGAKVRKNSVKHLNIVLTGSHERMKEIEKDPKALQKWANENYKFLRDKYGQDNIMRLSLHCDERTPHLHAVVTPITKDGRLSAREIVGNKKDMQQLQDDYAKKMSKFDLNRGVRGSKATHDSIQEYYARINNPIETKINLPSKKTFESNKAYMQRLQEAVEPIVFNNERLLKDQMIFAHNVQRYNENKENLEQEKESFTQDKEQLRKSFELDGGEKALNIANNILQKNNIDYRFEINRNTRQINIREAGKNLNNDMQI